MALIRSQDIMINISESFTINYSDKIISLKENENNYKRMLLVEKFDKPKAYTISQLYEYVKSTLRDGAIIT